MIGLEWTPAVRVIAGAERRRTRRRSPRAALVVDPAVSGSSIHRRTTDLLTARSWSTTVDIVGGPDDVAALPTLAAGLAHADLVVAIGGGTVLDLVKIASLVAGDDTLRTRLAAPTRSGLITAPVDAVRPAPLIAVPTTLGTGSEVSAVAAVRYPTVKRLVAGLALVPEAAVVDQVATQDLPPGMVAEAALEVLCRLTYPYICGQREATGQDRLIEAAAGHLLRLGYRVDELRRQGRPIPAPIRSELAALSGFSQSRWLGRFDEPFAAKSWVIANELSAFTGTRKMTAVAALLPQIWSRIDSGDDRFGSRSRLHRLWRTLTADAPIPLPADPAAGIELLIARWGIARNIALPPADVPALARRISRAWGAGLPMLAGLTTADVADVVAAALLPAPAGTAKTSAPAPVGAGAAGH